MTTVTWEDVAKYTGAEMVAGDLILTRTPADRAVLGRMRGTQFDFTEEGAEIAQRLQNKGRSEAIADADADADDKPKRGRPAKAKAEHDEEPDAATLLGD